MKKAKNQTKKRVRKSPNSPDENLVRNAVYVTNAFHFTIEKALTEINKGMLGYKVDKNGEPTKEPITIGRNKLIDLRIKYSELPESHRFLREFAMKGYTNLIIGHQQELAELHRMSIENLQNVDDPLERQQIIGSLIKDVIPTESGFADMLKSIIEDDKSITEPEGETPPEESEKQ